MLENLINMENAAFFLGGLGAGYVVFKLYLGKFKNLVDVINEAVADDTITMDEANKIFKALTPFIDAAKTWIASRKK